MLKCLRDEFFTPLAAIPTTGIDQTGDFNVHLATQIAQDNRGICVRLLPEDIDQPSISNIKLAAILQTLSVDRSNTTLLLDLRHVDEPAVNKAVQRVDKWIRKLGNITEWKEIIIAATGIPDSYSKYVRNTESLIPRSEVLIWDELQRSYPDIAARSIFADYCITPPKNPEPDKSTRGAMSAYIKYTLEGM